MLLKELGRVVGTSETKLFFHILVNHYITPPPRDKDIVYDFDLPSEDILASRTCHVETYVMLPAPMHAGPGFPEV